jgi:hypothetical protein
MLGGIWKSLLKTPGRNKNQDDGVPVNTSSPTRFSPNPKRQNTNHTPNKKGISITKKNEELNDDLTLLKAAGYQSKRIKKATEKARDAKALGR